MKKFIVICLFVLTVFAGCQNGDISADLNVDNKDNVNVLPPPHIESLPTSPPHVNGPSGPPPGVDSNIEEESPPQSVTEIETVEYSLPTDTKSDFKN